MKAKLIQRREICEGTIYSRFDLVNGSIEFKAGQFFKLTLLQPLFTDNRGNNRFLGFINSPSNNTCIETAVRVGTSAFKRSLSKMPLGDEVEINQIGGEMVLPEEIKTPLVIVTGGIGIVPYMSMFRLVKERSMQLPITLIYSNTKSSWAAFLEELTQIASENGNFKLVTTMTQDPEWQGEKRRIDENFLREHIGQTEGKNFYISGTPRFVPDMVRSVKTIGAAQQNLKFEIFTGY